MSVMDRFKLGMNSVTDDIMRRTAFIVKQTRHARFNSASFSIKLKPARSLTPSRVLMPGSLIQRQKSEFGDCDMRVQCPGAHAYGVAGVKTANVFSLKKKHIRGADSPVSRHLPAVFQNVPSPPRGWLQPGGSSPGWAPV